MDSNLKQYLITALWSTNDDAGDPLDDNYNIEDLSAEALEKATEDWALFIKKAGSLLDDLSLSDVAHDFWLTRNHHGAGFWDGDYSEEIGKQLTDISHSFGEINLYVGDDGKLHF